MTQSMEDDKKKTLFGNKMNIDSAMETTSAWAAAAAAEAGEGNGNGKRRAKLTNSSQGTNGAPKEK